MTMLSREQQIIQQLEIIAQRMGLDLTNKHLEIVEERQEDE